MSNMIKLNEAFNKSFDIMEVCGQIVLVSYSRVSREDIPEGLFLYDIRHSDNDWGQPATLENTVRVNWFGTIITKEPIDLCDGTDNDRFRNLNDDNYTFIDDGMTLETFMGSTFEVGKF